MSSLAAAAAPTGITKTKSPRKGGKTPRKPSGSGGKAPRASKPPVVAGSAERVPPCENCIKSALSGKGDFTGCVDCGHAKTKRCCHCFHDNHKCVPCRPYLIPLALKFREAVVAGDSSMTDRCRGAIRLVMELLNNSDPVFNGVPGCDDEQEEEESNALKAAFSSFVDKITKKK